MYAQLAYFDGPRSAEVCSASDYAGRNRIQPAIEADPQMQQELVSVLVVRQPDGSQVVIIVTRTEAGLLRAREIIMNTELLPDENPALLSEPDRVEVYEVVDSRVFQTAGV